MHSSPSVDTCAATHCYASWHCHWYQSATSFHWKLSFSDSWVHSARSKGHPRTVDCCRCYLWLFSLHCADALIAFEPWSSFAMSANWCDGNLHSISELAQWLSADMKQGCWLAVESCHGEKASEAHFTMTTTAAQRSPSARSHWGGDAVIPTQCHYYSNCSWG